MSKENAGGTVETPTVEELSQKLESEKAARLKAEAKIVDMKKSTKTTPEVKVEVKAEPKTEDTYMTKADFEKVKFFESNPNLVEHKESINELVSKGYSLEDAKIVTLNKDTTIKTRENTKKSNFTEGETLNTEKTTYTKEELGDEKITQQEYNKIMDLYEKGKVNIT